MALARKTLGNFLPVLEPDVAVLGRSDDLRRYPEDLAQSPPVIRRARFRLEAARIECGGGPTPGGAATCGGGEISLRR